jgi:peptidoglycan/LPS O-acetylase OafA/YrhL
MSLPETNPGLKAWLDAWHVNPSVNRDYDFIDGLRGVAILMVVVSHHLYFNPKSGALVHVLGSILGTGGHGVTLFFALSGFLISWPFWKKKSTGSEKLVPPGYVWRRFWKIYPPLALAVLLLTPIYIYRESDWSFLFVAAKWLAGLPAVLPVTGRFNPVMWSLVVEVQFYTVLPLLFVSLKHVPAKICLWVIPLIFLLVPLSTRLITGQTATFHPDIDSHFPAALDSFCIGIFVAGLENLGHLNKKCARIGVAGVVLWPLTMLVLALLNLHVEHKGFAFNEITGDAVRFAAGCMLFFVADPQHPVARLLCAPWLRWCGIISYEWYLFHQPIARWTRESFGPADGNVFRYVAIVGGSFVTGLFIAALVYRNFSLPILKRTRVKRPRA